VQQCSLHLGAPDYGGFRGGCGQYFLDNDRHGRYPVVSYYNETTQDLKVAKCSNAACTSVILTTVDSAGMSLVHLDSDRHGRLPVISYLDQTTEP